jgi:predicted transglutaminase-like cysteine proteinase
MAFSASSHKHPLYTAADRRVSSGRLVSWTLALIVVLVIVCAADASWADGRTYPPLFGTSEKMFPDSSVFPKWTEMLQHLVRDEAIEAMNVKPCRREQGLNICEVDRWKSFIETQRGKPIMDVLDNVNRFMNSYPYVLDIVNYGVEDYWATPHEHVSHGGDCEDYAIAKYMTLRRLGMSNMDMRIVVLNDLNLKVQHAILAVYIGNKIYILDNQTRRVQPAELIYHYQPIYSVTEGAWWMHLIAQAGQ